MGWFTDLRVRCLRKKKIALMEKYLKGLENHDTDALKIYAQAWDIGRKIEQLTGQEELMWES